MFSTRDRHKHSWDDLHLQEITSPFQDDVNLRDATITKTFIIEAETFEGTQTQK